jgi:hypothetical protein
LHTQSQFLCVPYRDKTGIGPPHQRMMDDMRMRRPALTTRANYVRVIQEFTIFVGCSPDTVTVEDLRSYQLHLVDQVDFPERGIRLGVLFRHDTRSRGVDVKDASYLFCAYLAGRHEGEAVRSLISAVLTNVGGFVPALYLAELFGIGCFLFYYGSQPVSYTVDDR